MSCDEERLVAFLAGELDADDAREIDAHLLDCEACWDAVRSDREGRLALELLRAPAPPGLADRVRAAVQIAEPATPSRISPIRRHPLQSAAAALVALVAGVGAFVVGLHQRAGDPPQVAAVIAMMRPAVLESRALSTGEHLVISGQPVLVRAYRVEGEMAIVATSMRPFAMPAASHLITGSSSRAWMATHGHLALYGVNHAPGKASMFVVAEMPVAQLPLVAAHLGLI